MASYKINLNKGPHMSTKFPYNIRSWSSAIENKLLDKCKICMQSIMYRELCCWKEKMSNIIKSTY